MRHKQLSQGHLWIPISYNLVAALLLNRELTGLQVIF